MIETWTAFPAGILISTVVTSIGLGGGILWMPFFLIALKMNPETAVITSLLIQVAGMGSGSIAYIRQKQAETGLAFIVFVAAIPGIIAGTLLAGRINLKLIECILGFLMIGTALLFLLSQNRKKKALPYTNDLSQALKRKFTCLFILVPALMSTASGMLSISMGEWLVPLMKSRLSMTIHKAIATCIVITFWACITGSVTHLFMGARPDVGILALAIPGVLIGGQLGPGISNRIKDSAVQQIFIIFLAFTGIYLVIKAL